MFDSHDPSGQGTPPDDAAHAAEGEPAREAPINWFAELRGLALMLLAVLAFHTFIAKPFYIPSESMMPGLLKGDRLVVSKFPYGWNWSSVSFHMLGRGDWHIAPQTPEYGDIVILQPPQSGTDYIKRVVALPGDRIAVVNGQIVLNGEPVPQEADVPVRIPIDPNAPCDYLGMRVQLETGEFVCEMPTYRETLPNGATYQIIDHTMQSLDTYNEITVPAGHVFLMGDNRDESADSRAPSSLDTEFGMGLGGPVPIHDIGGRAEFITFSLDGTFGWNPLSWIPAFRGDRAWNSLRPAIRPVAPSEDPV